MKSAGISPIAAPALKRDDTKEQQLTFPFKLYEMLQHAGESEFGSACYWSVEGDAFVIRNRTVMMKELVPMFFKQTKYRSFTRQLNLWGFIRTGTMWRHTHGLFHREKSHLLQRMGRVAIKSREPSPITALPLPLSPPQHYYSTPDPMCDVAPVAAAPITGSVFDYFSKSAAVDLSHQEAVDLAADFSLSVSSSSSSDETATTQEDSDVKESQLYDIEAANTDTSSCTTDDLLCLASIFEQKEEDVKTDDTPN